MKIALGIGIIALLIVLGVALYAFDFTSYLGNNPATCNNCHVMDYVYEGWYHSGHKNWAACNDCHTPHALIPKYAVKAANGIRHVSAFTFGFIPDAIRARESSKEIIQENCERCHAATIANVDMSVSYGENEPQRYCFECHRSIAHGERGVSILPYRNAEEFK